MKTVYTALALVGLLACFTTAVSGRRELLQTMQTYPACGSNGGQQGQQVTLNTSQLAFVNVPNINVTSEQSLNFSCSHVYSGYSRGCASNSTYNYIYEVIGEPPYLPKGQAARPYLEVYAKPADTALAVKQQLYNLDLQTGSIYVSPPDCGLSPGASYPQYVEFPLAYDAAGFPSNNGDVSGKTQQGLYAFYLNEIRSAVQNVTSAPGGDPAFACNPPQNALSGLLSYLRSAQGIFIINNIAGSRTIPLGPPLVTGPIPSRDEPQWD